MRKEEDCGSATISKDLTEQTHVFMVPLRTVSRRVKPIAVVQQYQT